MSRLKLPGADTVKETGVADIVDPLAGSYHVEELTATIKEKAKQLIVDLEKKEEY